MTPRSSNASPRPPPARFDAELLTPYIKKLLQTTLGNQRWPEHKEREKVKLWCAYRRQLHLDILGMVQGHSVRLFHFHLLTLAMFL